MPMPHNYSDYYDVHESRDMLNAPHYRITRMAPDPDDCFECVFLMECRRGQMEFGPCADFQRKG